MPCTIACCARQVSRWWNYENHRYHRPQWMRQIAGDGLSAVAGLLCGGRGSGGPPDFDGRFTCIPQLTERFGADILDEEGHLRRRLLADRAFKTAEGTKALSSITHPAIVAELNRQGCQAEQQGADLYFVDGAVIIGSPFEKECNGFVVVTAPLEASVARICARDGIAPEMARRRLDAQMPEQELLRWADYEIRNDGTIEQLKARTLQVLAALRGDQ